MSIKSCEDTISAALTVELVKAPESNTTGFAMFTIGNNVDNYYRLYVSAGNLVGEKKIAGSKSTLFTIPYDLTNHRFDDLGVRPSDHNWIKLTLRLN